MTLLTSPWGVLLSRTHHSADDTLVYAKRLGYLSLSNFGSCKGCVEGHAIAGTGSGNLEQQRKIMAARV
jgi:hypothetical protein